MIFAVDLVPKLHFAIEKIIDGTPFSKTAIHREKNAITEVTRVI